MALVVVPVILFVPIKAVVHVPQGHETDDM